MGQESGRPGSMWTPGTTVGANAPWRGIPDRRVGRTGPPVEREGADGMLGFLGRLARFGLAEGTEPLLRPLNRGT